MGEEGEGVVRKLTYKAWRTELLVINPENIGAGIIG